MNASFRVCHCKVENHQCKLIVITGGPGAGKTAMLEMAKRHFCQHISVLPEAASILYTGAYFRRDTEVSRKAGQRAIYHLQSELEKVIIEEKVAAVGLCDRGTLDGLAYWPGEEKDYWAQLGTTREKELAKYMAVIHMRTPDLENGYNHQNPIRLESVNEAMNIDKKIVEAWKGHPSVYMIESQAHFLDKVSQTLKIIETLLPTCCRSEYDA